MVRMAAKDGRVTEELLKFYTALAKGGTGLIVTGAIAVDQPGQFAPGNMAYFDDSYITGHKKLTDIVHDAGPGVKIAAQLAHSGRQSTHPKFSSVAPSSIPEDTTGRVPHELTPDEIGNIVAKFIKAGRWAYESGYDMVQLHAAHGYLLSSFLSPYMNVRADQYGGSTENRSRIFLEILSGMRKEVGQQFPITLKIQTRDGIPQGLSQEEGIEIAKRLVDAGYDAIEPSGGFGGTLMSKAGWGIPSCVVKSPADENYFLPAAKAIKKVVPKCPVILMGGVRNPVSADQILKEGSADFIAMCRPLIREPDLPNRWYSGDLTPAKCKSCNSCYKSLTTGPLECATRHRLELRQARQEKQAK